MCHCCWLCTCNAELAGGILTRDLSGVPDGEYAYYSKATDVFFNEIGCNKDSSVKFVLDTTAPSISATINESVGCAVNFDAVTEVYHTNCDELNFTVVTTDELNSLCLGHSDACDLLPMGGLTKEEQTTTVSVDSTSPVATDISFTAKDLAGNSRR